MFTLLCAPECDYILGWSSFTQRNQNSLNKKMGAAGKQIKHLSFPLLNSINIFPLFKQFGAGGSVCLLSNWTLPPDADLGTHAWNVQTSNTSGAVSKAAGEKSVYWWWHVMTACSWRQQVFKWQERGIMCRSIGKESTDREMVELGHGWSLLLRTTLIVSRY